jgi:hypothetical protein
MQETDKGHMSLHWLQGMPFWATWLSGYHIDCVPIRLVTNPYGI